MSNPSGSAVPKHSLVLALLVAAQLLVVIDFSIVQIALPTVRNELRISIADLQWILSTYGLAIAVTLIGAATGAGIAVSASTLVGGFRLASAGATVISGISLLMALIIGRAQVGAQSVPELNQNSFPTPESSSIIEESRTDDFGDST